MEIHIRKFLTQFEWRTLKKMSPVHYHVYVGPNVLMSLLLVEGSRNTSLILGGDILIPFDDFFPAHLVSAAMAIEGDVLHYCPGSNIQLLKIKECKIKECEMYQIMPCWIPYKKQIEFVKIIKN